MTAECRGPGILDGEKIVWFWAGSHAQYDSFLKRMKNERGSNPSNSSLFRQDLQTLANRIGLEIRIAHYPPYCSKHNPIEHRLFPHVTRACEGVVFKSVPLVKELIGRTQTKTGLSVSVDILNKVYETGRKASEHLKSTLKIIADSVLPQWNYTVSPQSDNELPQVVF